MALFNNAFLRQISRNLLYFCHLVIYLILIVFSNFFEKTALIDGLISSPETVCDIARITLCKSVEIYLYSLPRTADTSSPSRSEPAKLIKYRFPIKRSSFLFVILNLTTKCDLKDLKKEKLSFTFTSRPILFLLLGQKIYL